MPRSGQREPRSRKYAGAGFYQWAGAVVFDPGGDILLGGMNEQGLDITDPPTAAEGRNPVIARVVNR